MANHVQQRMNQLVPLIHDANRLLREAEARGVDTPTVAALGTALVELTDEYRLYALHPDARPDPSPEGGRAMLGAISFQDEAFGR